MLLTAAKISEVYRLVRGVVPAQIQRLRGAQMTLSSAIMLGLWSEAEEVVPTCRQEIATLGLAKVAEVSACIRATDRAMIPNAFGAPDFELYRIGGAADLTSEEWPLFYERFRRSAAGGRTSAMFRTVGGILGEMGDNVVSHAYSANAPCRALAGYHVQGNMASFCVTDLGRGFRASLRGNPKWAHLRSDQDALNAVVNEHATGRAAEEEGGGFKQLFKVLLDFNGLVVLRSGDCTVTLVNHQRGRKVTVRLGEPVPGASVTVVISLRGEPREPVLENSA